MSDLIGSDIEDELNVNEEQQEAEPIVKKKTVANANKSIKHSTSSKGKDSSSGEKRMAPTSDRTSKEKKVIEMKKQRKL